MPRMPPTHKPHGKLSAKASRTYRYRERYPSRWDALSRAFKLAHPLCAGCKAIGRVAQTEVTDHTEPHDGDERLMWDQANWAPLCSFCHNVVKSRLEHQWRCGAITAAELKPDSATFMRLRRQLDPPGGQF